MIKVLYLRLKSLCDPGKNLSECNKSMPESLIRQCTRFISIWRINTVLLCPQDYTKNYLQTAHFLCGASAVNIKIIE